MIEGSGLGGVASGGPGSRGSFAHATPTLPYVVLPDAISIEELIQ